MNFGGWAAPKIFFRAICSDVTARKALAARQIAGHDPDPDASYIAFQLGAIELAAAIGPVLTDLDLDIGAGDAHDVGERDPERSGPCAVGASVERAKGHNGSRQ